MSEKKIENANVNEEVKVNKVTGEVQDMKTSENISEERFLSMDYDYDPYAQSDTEESSGGFAHLEGGVFFVPNLLRRKPGGKSKDGFQYYDYYVGFTIVVDPENRSLDSKQILRLVPVSTFQDAHKILDVIYKGTDQKQLEIEKSVRSTTINGRRISEPYYTCRVSGKDGMGYPIAVSFNPAQGNKVLLDVLIERYKFDGIIK